MTQDEFPAFVGCFNNLAMLLPDPNPDPTGLKPDLYFDVLSTWSLRVVEAAAHELSRSGGAYFPSSAVWCEAARLQSLKLRDRPYRSAVFDRANHLLPAASGPAEDSPFFSREEAKRTLERLKACYPAAVKAPPPRDTRLSVIKAIWQSDWTCAGCGISVQDAQHRPACPTLAQRTDA